MAWYSSVEAATVAIIGAVGVAAGTAFKLRRNLAKDNSDITQEKSNAHAGAWLNEQLMAQVVRAEAAREATVRAARELFEQRVVDVEKMARQEERLANCERSSAECQDRAQRAESRAAVAEEHMRTQAEQILTMSLKIDSLTTALARHDPGEAARLSPKPKDQPLLIPPSTEGPA